MKRPKKLAPMVYIEIEENWRWREGAPECVFLTVIRQRNELHREIAHTEHLNGSGESLFDLVQSRVNELRREYILTEMEPF